MTSLFYALIISQKVGSVKYIVTNGNALNYAGGHNLPEREVTILGWQPTCKCGKDPVPAVILDPFAGSGTTLQVAKELNRKAIGIEIKPEYCDLIIDRCRQQVMSLGV